VTSAKVTVADGRVCPSNIPPLNRVPLERRARLCTGNANPAGVQFQHSDTTPAKSAMAPIGQQAGRGNQFFPLYVVTSEDWYCLHLRDTFQ